MLALVLRNSTAASVSICPASGGVIVVDDGSRRRTEATASASARKVSLTKQAVQAISRFALQGNSALLRSDLDGPVEFSFGFVALTD